MRLMRLSALCVLVLSFCRASGAQLFGLGMPSPQIQPAHINPISTPSGPSLQSLPGLGRSSQGTPGKAPDAGATGPGGLIAQAPLIGSTPLLTAAPIVGLTMAPDAKLVTGPFIVPTFAGTGGFMAEAPIINAPKPEKGAEPLSETTRTEGPVLADNALTVISLPVVGLASIAPGSLAPPSLALAVNSPVSLAPGSLALKSDRPALLALPILALPVVDMMGVPAPISRARR